MNDEMRNRLDKAMEADRKRRERVTSQADEAAQRRASARNAFTAWYNSVFKQATKEFCEAVESGGFVCDEEPTFAESATGKHSRFLTRVSLRVKRGSRDTQGVMYSVFEHNETREMVSVQSHAFPTGRGGIEQELPIVDLDTDRLQDILTETFEKATS